MASVHFTQQALIEIFCRVLAKGMQKDISDFYNPLKQKEYLDEFTSKPKSERFAKEHFGIEPNPNGGSKNVLPNLLYDLQCAINNGGMGKIGQPSIKKIEKFLGYKLNVEQIVEPKFDPSEKDKFLAGSKWIEYYKDIQKQKDGSKLWGISCSILSFEPFGKVTLEAFNADKNKEQSFVGTYKLFGQNQENLTITLKLTTALHKVLTFNYNVGSEDFFDFAVGIWGNNMGKNMGGGITVIVHCPLDEDGNPIEEILSPGFYKFDSDEIPLTFNEFFKTVKSSYTRIPTSVINLQEFSQFLHDIKKILEGELSK